MIGNYAFTAAANAIKAPFTTAAKVLTLVLGLLVLVTVCGIIAYWRSADRQIAPAGEHAVLFTTQIKIKGAGVDTSAWTSVQPMLETYIRSEIPQIKTLARLAGVDPVAFSAGGRTAILNGAKTEPDFFQIFAFPFLAGDARTALRQDDAIVLTQSAARRLFGDSPALGRKLVVGGQKDMVVTGVIADPQQPSRFQFDFLGRLGPPPPGPDLWGIDGGQLYALLPEGMTRADLKARLSQLVKRHPPTDPEPDRWRITLGVAPISQEVEFDLNGAVFGPATGGSSSVVGALSGFALLVLAVALLNYANLAAAQTLTRAKELGMRRVLGAGPMNVLTQSWIESGLATLLALGLTVAAMALAAPIMKTQLGVDGLGALMRDPDAMVQVCVFVAIVALVAGLYPAFLSLRIRPVDALRSSASGALPRGVGQVLVGLQFASASALLIALIVVGHQNERTRELALNHDGDKVVVLPPLSQTGVSADLLRQQVTGRREIRAVGEAISLWSGDGADGGPIARTSQAARSAPETAAYSVGFGYLEVFGQRALAGRVFDPARDRGHPAEYMTSEGVLVSPEPPPGPRPVVIDDDLSRALGFSTPIAAVGQSLYDREGKALEIIGVVENRAHAVRLRSRTGARYELVTGHPDAMPIVRVGAKDIGGGLGAMRQAFAQLAPDRTFSYRFEDQIFDEKFKTFALVGRLFAALSLIALLIATMGLVGMAAHATQRRLQEIGVRKTLGSTSGEVVRLLLADFSKPVVWANVMIWPVAYWGAKAYLTRFAEPIELTPWPFALSLIVTMAIAWLAVGGQTLRAAAIRPAEVLRDA